MAPPKQDAAAAPSDPAAALGRMERPGIKWKVVVQVALGLAVLWVVAFMTVPWIGYWGVGVVGALTAAVLGFGLYAWRMTRRSAAIVDILKTATDPEGRQKALEALEAQGKNDAMSALARAQLVAQESPGEAMAILEGVDLDKAPAVVRDEVRANLALMYLVQNRVRDAREVVEEIRLDRQPQAKAKAMYAAVVSEAWARTGKPDEAKKLLETYDVDDPEFAEVRPILLRARVYTFVGTKNRGLARQAMQRLAALDPNMVMALAQKGGQPEVAKMARQLAPKQRMKRVMR
ncbi:MAG: tetratricopeptide repeat protein [Myxococcota bacterium]